MCIQIWRKRIICLNKIVLSLLVFRLIHRAHSNWVVTTIIFLSQPYCMQYWQWQYRVHSEAISNLLNATNINTHPGTQTDVKTTNIAITSEMCDPFKQKPIKSACFISVLGVRTLHQMLLYNAVISVYQLSIMNRLLTRLSVWFGIN